MNPIPVINITDAQGNLVWQANPTPKQVVDPAVASAADQILQKVVLYGTGTAANIGRPQIGKTGTNQNYTDAWFVGAIPQLVAAVWVGFPQGQISMQPSTTRITVFGGTWPAQIWRLFMTRAAATFPVREFPTPDVNYIAVAVDVTLDPYCLPNQFTLPANIQTLEFIAGTEPTQDVHDSDLAPVGARPLRGRALAGSSDDAARRRGLLRQGLGRDVHATGRRRDLAESSRGHDRVPDERGDDHGLEGSQLPERLTDQLRAPRRHPGVVAHGIPPRHGRPRPGCPPVARSRPDDAAPARRSRSTRRGSSRGPFRRWSDRSRTPRRASPDPSRVHGAHHAHASGASPRCLRAAPPPATARPRLGRHVP